jgi:thermitase
MKTILSIFILLVGLTATAQSNNLAAGRMLVTFKTEAHYNKSTNSFGNTTLDSLNNALGCINIHPLKHNSVYVLQFPVAADIPALIRTYKATGLFRSVSPDATGSIQGSAAPNDTLFSKQWPLQNLGGPNAKTGADINMLKAWDIEEGDSSIIVAVIDAGAKMDHPDFEGRLWRNHKEMADSTDNDGNGYDDDTLGWNFVKQTADPADDQGHGTMVAGIIGANTDNITGMAGVDKHCKLMVCKALNHQGICLWSWVIEAIYYAVDNGAHVINMSLGGGIAVPELEDAVNYAYNHGVVVVVAMGNSGNGIAHYPAVYKNVIAVGATNAMDTTWKMSSFGEHISLVAPGENIYMLAHTSDTGVVCYSGTSFAAPHVAGIASLLLAQDKTRKPADIKTLLQNNADDMVGSAKDVAGWDKYYGHGRLNAYRTLINDKLTVSNTKRENTVQIYPVPASEVVHINTTGMAGAFVNISNISGIVVYNSIVESTNHNIDVRNFPKGNYILTIDRKGELVSRKLVVE